MLLFYTGRLFCRHIQYIMVYISTQKRIGKLKSRMIVYWCRKCNYEVRKKNAIIYYKSPTTVLEP